MEEKLFKELIESIKEAGKIKRGNTMKPYIVTLEVVTKWIMEVHAEDKQQAEKTAEGLDYAQIETGGEFGKVVSIEATNVELLYSEDEDDEIGKEEVVPEPDDTVTEVEVESEPEEDKDVDPT